VRREHNDRSAVLEVDVWAWIDAAVLIKIRVKRACAALEIIGRHLRAANETIRFVCHDTHGMLTRYAPQECEEKTEQTESSASGPAAGNVGHE
jgi:hypothetical protein